MNAKKAVFSFNVLVASVLLSLFGHVALGNSKCLSVYKKSTHTKPVQDEAYIALDSILNSAKQIRESDIGIHPKEIVDLLKENQRFQWIASKIMKNQVSFAMNRNEERRRAIAQHGFLNQFEAKRSGGYYDIQKRRQIEAAYSNLPLEAYDKIPISMRPKYGYLAPVIGDQLSRSSSAADFGSDTYIFKMERLKNRTSWVPGDSLDQYDYYIDDYGKAKIPRASRFLPWSSRALLLPYLDSPNGANELGIVAQTDNKLNVGGKLIKLPTTVNQDYIELQFWGTLSLDDVEAFIFKTDPPKGKFLLELKRRNIRIFQNDGENDILWWEPKAR